MGGNGQVTVPPGFRFHPTDEELLYYYLRKKVSYESIDLDVIREVDLNKLEPWDLKDRCRIGSGPQNEWYFFSHKDKKYPTGTRTNRATTAGFWKATGRDKAIHLSNSIKIGMRKTLVFYTGRAPHGQKTDWIMHEYRLDDENSSDVQEDGWVVCRVFKKKNQSRGFLAADNFAQEENNLLGGSSSHPNIKHNLQMHMQSFNHDYNNYGFDCSMQLPQLFSPESAPASASLLSNLNNAAMDNIIDCSQQPQNLLRLTTLMQQPVGRSFNGDWSFLDKLLASHHQNQNRSKVINSSSALTLPTEDRNHMASSSSTHNKFPLPYFPIGCDNSHEILKFSK